MEKFNFLQLFIGYVIYPPQDYKNVVMQYKFEISAPTLEDAIEIKNNIMTNEFPTKDYKIIDLKEEISNIDIRRYSVSINYFKAIDMFDSRNEIHNLSESLSILIDIFKLPLTKDDVKLLCCYDKRIENLVELIKSR